MMDTRCFVRQNKESISSEVLGKYTDLQSVRKLGQTSRTAKRWADAVYIPWYDPGCELDPPSTTQTGYTIGCLNHCIENRKRKC